ncbi:RDD family protein [Vibrio mexicanus]|uniref:RDD family protein n=1 Tax=Vibrio mexicanus TaxID=1004326 RepID=UPI00063C59EF|nr:RDD family protein [Vibrio mexicanus]
MTTTQPLPNAGLMRRLGALFYDALIILALEMMAAGLIIALLQAFEAMSILNVAPYIDISDMLSKHPVWSPLFTLYLAVVWIYFFVFFWTRAGQTLGMRAWKLQVRNQEGGRITATQALIRIATSAFGLGNLIVLFDPKNRSFQDIWAKTDVVVLPKAN